MLTGLAGSKWVDAAAAVAEALGIELHVHVIGPGQRFVDTYGDFAKFADISESGALLVRPDMFIAWRTHTTPEYQVTGLMNALKSILDLN